MKKLAITVFFATFCLILIGLIVIMSASNTYSAAKFNSSFYLFNSHLTKVLIGLIVMAVFWLAGGLILTVLGIISIKHSLQDEEISYTPDHLKRKRWAFLGGLSLSATNPMMILWWLTGVKIFKDIGLITSLDSRTAISFLSAGSLGLASYLAGLSLFIFWAKKFISKRTLRRINLFFGSFLVVIAIYFIYTSFRAILHI